MFLLLKSIRPVGSELPFVVRAASEWRELPHGQAPLSADKSVKLF